MNMNKIAEYKSQVEAAKKFNVHRKQISAYCYERRKNIDGFIFRFANQKHIAVADERKANIKPKIYKRRFKKKATINMQMPTDISAREASTDDEQDTDSKSIDSDYDIEQLIDQSADYPSDNPSDQYVDVMVNIENFSSLKLTDNPS